MGRRLNEDLGPKMRAAALLFGTGSSVQDVASEVGVSRRTVWMWQRDPQFQREVAIVRDAILSELTGRLAKLGGRAVDELEGLLSSDLESIRLRSVQTVLDTLLRCREATDISVQLAELRARAEQAERMRDR